MIGAIYWNPPIEAFRVPIIDRPVVWYGIFFVTGFILGYFITYGIFKKLLIQNGRKEAKTEALYLTDRLTWFVVAGTLIGARLGHVLFYDPIRYFSNPIEILQIWKGGLASHGGIIGVLIALYLFYRFSRKRYPELTFIGIVDIVAIPAALAAFFIRIGNFFNQEIIGTPSSLPWAVIFGHPADGSFPEPRHPVQLYEAGAYLLTFIFLFTLFRRMGSNLRAGMISGLLFILINTSRFFLEFFKSSQHGIIEGDYLQTGQYLSIPFILLGLFLFFFGSRFATENKGTIS